MWRTDDLYAALWQMGRPGHRAARPARRGARRASGPPPRCPRARSCTAPGCSSRCPRCRAAARWCSSTRWASTRCGSGTRSTRREVAVLTIVGDAFARPLLDALDAEPDRWSLASLRAITSSGVTWSPEVKRGLLDHLPDVTLLDSLGASEGLMSRSAARAADADIPPARFAVNDRVRVLTDDGREVAPGQRRDRHGRRGRADPARLLQGPREDRGHVPHRRRRPLLDPRRLRERRRRRHDPAPRPRLGHREHRRREGVPRGGRARAARAPGDRRLRGRRRPRRALRRDGGGDGGHPRRPSTRPRSAPTARTGASPGTRSPGASSRSPTWDAPRTGRPTTRCCAAAPPPSWESTPDGRPFRDRRLQPRHRGTHRAEPRPAPRGRRRLPRRAPGLGGHRRRRRELRAPHRPVGAARVLQGRGRERGRVAAGRRGRAAATASSCRSRTAPTPPSCRTTPSRSSTPSTSGSSSPAGSSAASRCPGVGWIFSLRRPGARDRQPQDDAAGEEGGEGREGGARRDRRGDRRRAHQPDRRPPAPARRARRQADRRDHRARGGQPAGAVPPVRDRPPARHRRSRGSSTRSRRTARSSWSTTSAATCRSARWAIRVRRGRATCSSAARPARSSCRPSTRPAAASSSRCPASRRSPARRATRRSRPR